ncbi:MAG: IS1595 family transposase [Aestuariivirga sp.]|nr:IS1595 family transposase [Aestuariivirga sp.]
MTNLTDPIFTDADKAREYFETIRWPNGPYCPHCGNADEDEIVKLTSKKHRAGLYQCRECREQFTVTVGSVMESSHIPLNKWALGFYLMASSKKGVSAHQLMRTLGIGSYRTAWFMAHRIREAMIEETGDTGPFGGPGKVVEADETYHGQRETPRKRTRKPTRGGKQGGAEKRVIVGLVERGGRVRTFHVQSATAESVRDLLVKNVSRKSVLHTDESRIYTETGKEFAGHHTVVHTHNEYVRGNVHTNTVENVWSVFKRGMKGIYQHCGEAHLPRYLAEFDFRYNRRSSLGISDTERAHDAIRGAARRRLMYRQASEA